MQVYQVIFSTQHSGMLQTSMQTPHGDWDVVVDRHPTQHICSGVSRCHTQRGLFAEQLCALQGLDLGGCCYRVSKISKQLV